MSNVRWSFRRTLLAGAAAVALSAMPAQAEDVITGPKMWKPSSFWLEIEGAYQWVSGSKQPWISDGLGQTLFGPQTLFSARPDTALQGKIEVGFKINQKFDVAFAYTGLRENKETASRSNPLYLYNVVSPIKSYYDQASVETRSTMHVVDFEVGYEMGLGSRGIARVHAGLRFAHFSNDTDVQLFFPGNSPYSSESLRNKSWGIGPRVGVSGKFRLVRTSRGILSVVGAFSGSVLFGQTTTSTSYENNFGFVPPVASYSKRSANTIFNIEGKVGLSYAFPLGAWGAAITVGYRGSAWWNAVNTKTAPNLNPGTAFPTQFPGAGDKSGNRFYHGPFISFRINF